MTNTDNQEKKTFKEKVREKWEQTKQFCAEHKIEIGVGAAIVLSVLGISIAVKSGSQNIDDSNYDYSPRRLRKMSYDELHKLREMVQMKDFGPHRTEKLDYIDNVLSNVTNPRAEHARTLSDDELHNELEEARSKFYKEYEIYKRDKRSYAELIQDADYRKYQENYDKFYQLNSEKQRRYAEQHPEKFPIHKEHGWHLPEDD